MSKELFIRMQEADFNRLSDHSQAWLNHYANIEVREQNEWETHKDDPNYKKLAKERKTAAKAVQEYLFNKRHGRNSK